MKSDSQELFSFTPTNGFIIPDGEVNKVIVSKYEGTGLATGAKGFLVDLAVSPDRIIATGFWNLRSDGVLVERMSAPDPIPEHVARLRGELKRAIEENKDRADKLWTAFVN